MLEMIDVANYSLTVLADCIRSMIKKHTHRFIGHLALQRTGRCTTQFPATPGYRTLEDACEKDDGFSIVRSPNEMELQQIAKLETITRQILHDLPFDLPPCKIIISESAVWRGMAVCTPINPSSFKYHGTPIRFHLP
jgi:hypothetical protein